jgi:hypothetical protein
MMSLPFTAEQFFDVFGAYNRALWPAVIGLWISAVIAMVTLARYRPHSGRSIAAMLAVQWAWAGLVYHAAFFSSINRAAWLFCALFVAESGLLIRHGVVHDGFQFSRLGSPRHILAWGLIAYALAYPLLVLADGYTFPRMPTYGVPCPTTLLTIGFLFAVDPPLPRSITIIPIVWAGVAGSAAVLLGVRADLMLWVAGIALAGYVLTPKMSSAPA